MELEAIATIVSFAIPIVLIIVSCTTEKIIEGTPWHRKHFFLGIDLTTYFLTASLINVADLARAPVQKAESYVYTVALITVAVAMLFVQTAFHQEWEAEQKSRVGQYAMLVFASNGIGVCLLYSFIRLKLRGLL